MDKVRQVSRIQVPNELLLEKNIRHEAFGMYVALKKYAYNNKVNTNLQTLRNRLRWKDNRTVKRYLNVLQENEFVKFNESEATRYNNFDLEFTTLSNSELGFTQVDKDTLDRIETVTKEKVRIGNNVNATDIYSIALRLFYYYEKNFNSNYGYSFPSYENVANDIGLSGVYMKSINDVFHESGLVKIRVGSLMRKEGKDGKIEIKRENNLYIPQCNRYEH